MSKNQKDNQTRIVEVDGIKMEVDLREAKKIDHYRVGDTVKILIAEYSDSYNNYFGVIVGFTEFQKVPSIDVLYVKDEFGDTDLKIVTINEKTEDIEIAPVGGYDAEFNRANILEKINRQIEKQEEKVWVLKSKKNAFIKHFGKKCED